MSLKSSVVVAFIVIAVLVCSAFSVIADDTRKGSLQSDVITTVPRTMTYQGIIKNGDDEPIPESFFDVTFCIFDAETDGNQEWTETIINIETDSEGRFTTTFANVDLGFDEDYWLEMEIASEVLTPRQKLNMTPFAGASVVSDYAWDANMLAGNSSDYYATADHSHSEAAGWVDDGPVVRSETSTDDVGIGTSSPQAKLHAASSTGGPWGTIYGQYTGNNNYGYLGGSSYGAFGSGNTAGVYGIHPASGNFGMIGCSAYGVYGRSEDGAAGYFYGDVQITDDLFVLNNVSVGTQVTATALDIVSFRMNNGATAGYVLTSDAAGYGTWQALNAVQGSGTTNRISKFTSANSIGDSQIFDNGTNVGIGLTSPAVKLDVNGDIWARNGLIIDNSIQVGDLIEATRIWIDQFRLTLGASSNYVLTSDAAGNGTWQALNAIGGSGTNNYIPRFNSANSVTNSIIFDNGTNVGIGTISPTSKLDVNGATRFRGSSIIDGNMSVANNIDANKITISQFQKMGGASAGYVLTSDASGNGTWQALPSSINSETIGQLESKLNEMMDIIEAQNAKIEQLENKIANLERNR